MKHFCWKIIMALTIGFMFIGFVISWMAIESHQTNLVYLGLVIIGTVCVSWWFWVMFVIRSMIKHSTTTLENVETIKLEIAEIKKLLSR